MKQFPIKNRLNSVNKEAQFKKFFQLTSIVTDLSQKRGASFLNSLMKNLLGNAILYKYLTSQYHHRLAKVNKLKRFLVVSDLNIGDAIIAVSGVAALRKIFPDAEIDFVYKKSTQNLMLGNPHVSNFYPVYDGAPFPLNEDLTELKHISSSKRYDIIVNYSPMISDKIFGKDNVINYTTMAAELIRNEVSGKYINNINYLSYNFIGKIFNESLPADFEKDFKGSEIYLSETAIQNAESFLLKHDVDTAEPIIMINPDASAKFTRMPFDFQIELLNGLTDYPYTILLGAGHVEKLLEQKLFFSLSPDKKKKIIIVPPTTELDTYAALIDLADVFISGDTGPLHLAAARKFFRNTGESLRNKTAVFSIFGGTPPRIYGYDSKIPGFFPANQDAPSKIFISNSPCRNITCINKLAKTCSEVRCFQSLMPDKIVSDIVNYLRTVQRNRVRDIEVFRQQKTGA